MTKCFHCDQVLLNDRFKSGYVCVKNGIITEITDQKPDFDCITEIDGFLVPGFIDLHFHGALDYDFSTADAKQIAKICDYHLSHGTTTMLPTVTSAKIETVKKSLNNIKDCINQSLTKAHIYGVHLEGPYFSKNQCGAQNCEHITPPVKQDYEQIIKDYGSIIKRWSYAPERDTNDEFCKYLVKNNVLPSMGHSDAKYDDCVSAFENGCKLVTHLYSCTSTVTRNCGFRSGGIIESAFLLDDLYVEIIADGCHLPKELVSLIYKIKGTDRICLVTDSIAATGTKNRETKVGDVPAIIEDGVAKLLDRTAFAGSIATADRLVRTCVEFGIPLVSALKMASTTPAKLLGLNAGIIATGYQADFVVLDNSLCVKDVYVLGEHI